MMGFAVVVGAALANPNGVQVSLPSIAYGFITGFTLTGASMAINDYYDRRIDAINEPGRPIPSGVVKPKQALVFAAMLTGVGFVAAFLANLSCLVIAVVAWLMFSAYTTVGKRSGLPGNFLVSACVAVPFIYGSAVSLGVISTNILLFVSMVFLSNTGREITKGIVDVQGDKGQGVKTLAVRWGEKRAAVTAAVFYVAAVLLSPLPWLLNVVSVWFLPLVAVTDVGLVASSFMLLKDYSRESARKVKKTVLLWFLLGLLAFIAGARAL
jgi:geranylgeranylglycerol-phosphate geranylgeranyltransferase